jgi:alkylhydroperoxidase family enzyme
VTGSRDGIGGGVYGPGRIDDPVAEIDPGLRELIRIRASQLNGCAYCIDMHVPEQACQDVAAEFSPLQVAALVSLIVTINAWNAIGVSTRAWAPGSYNP